MSFSDPGVPASAAAAPGPRAAAARHQAPDVAGMVLHVELGREAKREAEETPERITPGHILEVR